MKPTLHHNFPKDVVLKEFISADLGTIYFYDNIVVTEMNEGVSVSFKTGASLLSKCLKIVELKPFVIISNRINSYSLNPNDYKYLSKIPSLKGICIVADREEARENAKLEAIFFKKPIAIFETMEMAYSWSQNILQN
ncbi:hypothetical protein [Patiriisocius hiemis]|uniref:STAS/SEC14 domain-containing protein n=1 Tax=Patiriisocius hiemis TaxID=3075604 RepID=A0ABU2YFP4_9FLAO|nr:hypothetical protein [Constantimarinum sp. W242]MDT0556605.1 hypothetical protein [Constantimarinum sp. W242]